MTWSLTIAAFFPQKRDQFDQIGRAKFQKQQAALHFLRNVADRRGDHDEFPLVAAAFVDIPQAPPDFRRFAQRLMEVHEVKNGRDRDAPR